MQYKHFNLSISIRLLILMGLSGAVVWAVNTERYMSALVLFVTAIIAAMVTVRYFNQVNRWISFFLLGIENEDTTLKIPTKTGSKAIDEVLKGMEKLNLQFRKIKIEIAIKEAQFSSIINQSATGLFSINQHNRVVHINPAAEKLTGLRPYHHLNTLLAINENLPEILNTTSATNPVSVVFENKNGQKLHFKCSTVNAHNEEYKLFAVSDITKELDTREVDAWVKLSRTLAHEIMNNLTPITTLSAMLSGYFRDDKPERFSETKVVQNTRKGLEIIEERSIALKNFVENYRKFTKLPEPKSEKIPLFHLVDNLILSCQSFDNDNIVHIENKIVKEQNCLADKDLLSQVIINIIKNAIEALKNTQKPAIYLHLHDEDNLLALQICNNGPEIAPEVRGHIFVPFFSTKEGGSGIGLSLSKQIMLRMGGDVRLQSLDGITCFEVLIPKS